MVFRGRLHEGHGNFILRYLSSRGKFLLSRTTVKGRFNHGMNNTSIVSRRNDRFLPSFLPSFLHSFIHLNRDAQFIMCWFKWGYSNRKWPDTAMNSSRNQSHPGTSSSRFLVISLWLFTWFGPGTSSSSGLMSSPA